MDERDRINAERRQWKRATPEQREQMLDRLYYDAERAWIARETKSPTQQRKQEMGA